MANGVVLPKFLTEDIAKRAIGEVINAVFQRGLNIVNQQACHIVVLVPSMKDGRPDDYSDYPDFVLKPHVLCSESYNREAWPQGHKLDVIAKCKALQLWQGRNDDRTDAIPHLLFPGDCPFWGGVKRHGIVVACSGVHSWLDKMISGMVADMMIGMAYDAWMRSDDHAKNVHELT